MPTGNLKAKRRRALLALLLALATTTRAGQNDRGVWTIQAPGLELVYLQDRAGRQPGGAL